MTFSSHLASFRLSGYHWNLLGFETVRRQLLVIIALHKKSFVFSLCMYDMNQNIVKILHLQDYSREFSYLNINSRLPPETPENLISIMQRRARN